jgi:hypothetical protein
VSFTEILEELPKLTQEQRQAIYRQIEELDGAPLFKATDEMLVASNSHKRLGWPPVADDQIPISLSD